MVWKSMIFCLVCKGVFLWDFELVIAISSENCSISKGCPLYFIDGNMDIFGEPMIFNIISQLTNLRVEVQVYCSLSAQVLMLLRTWAMCPHIVISHLMAFFLHVSYSKWNSSCLFFCQYTAWVAFSWQKKGKKNWTLAEIKIHWKVTCQTLGILTHCRIAPYVGHLRQKYQGSFLWNVVRDPLKPAALWVNSESSEFTNIFLPHTTSLWR